MPLPLVPPTSLPSKRLFGFRVQGSGIHIRRLENQSRTWGTICYSDVRLYKDSRRQCQ